MNTRRDTRTKQYIYIHITNLSISKDGGIVTLEAAFDQVPDTRVINVDLCNNQGVIIAIVHDSMTHQWGTCNKGRR